MYRRTLKSVTSALILFIFLFGQFPLAIFAAELPESYPIVVEEETQEEEGEAIKDEIDEVEESESANINSDIEKDENTESEENGEQQDEQDQLELGEREGTITDEALSTEFNEFEELEERVFNFSLEEANTSITVRWPEVTGATGYNIYYATSSAQVPLVAPLYIDNCPSTGINVINTCEYKINGLINTTEYFVNIQPVFGVILGELFYSSKSATPFSVVIDDDAQFSQTSAITGIFTPYDYLQISSQRGTAPLKNDNTYNAVGEDRYESTGDGSFGNKGIWQTGQLLNGHYDIYVNYQTFADNASNVTYTIGANVNIPVPAAGSDLEIGGFNQRLNKDGIVGSEGMEAGWIKLGRYNFNNILGIVTISSTNGTTGRIQMDAVAFQKVEVTRSLEVVVDVRSDLNNADSISPNPNTPFGEFTSTQPVYTFPVQATVTVEGLEANEAVSLIIGKFDDPNDNSYTDPGTRVQPYYQDVLISDGSIVFDVPLICNNPDLGACPIIGEKLGEGKYGVIAAINDRTTRVPSLVVNSNFFIDNTDPEFDSVVFNFDGTDIVGNSSANPFVVLNTDLDKLSFSSILSDGPSLPVGSGLDRASFVLFSTDDAFNPIAKGANSSAAFCDWNLTSSNKSYLNDTLSDTFSKFGNQCNEYGFSFAAGKYIVVLRTYDNAGNFRDSANFYVEMEAPAAVTQNPTVQLSNISIFEGILPAMTATYTNVPNPANAFRWEVKREGGYKVIAENYGATINFADFESAVQNYVLEDRANGTNNFFVDDPSETFVRVSLMSNVGINAEARVNILNELPIVTLNAATGASNAAHTSGGVIPVLNVQAGQLVNFSGSFTDNAGDFDAGPGWQARINYGGTGFFPGIVIKTSNISYNVSIPSQIYANGTYNVVLRICEEGNLYGFCNTANIVLNVTGGTSPATDTSGNPLPSGTIGSISQPVGAVLGEGDVQFELNLAGEFIGEAGQAIELRLSASGVDLTGLTCVWNFGDGTTSTTTGDENLGVSKIYANEGLYNLSVTCTDSNGASVTETSQVVVGQMGQDQLGVNDSPDNVSQNGNGSGSGDDTNDNNDSSFNLGQFISDNWGILILLPLIIVIVALVSYLLRNRRRN